MPGTGKPLLRLTSEERKEVKATLRREDLAPRVRERLEMVKAADLGHGLEEVAAWSGRTPRTVRRWLGRFASGDGIEALADGARSGRPARGAPLVPTPLTCWRLRRRRRPRRER
jgi:hypothetical protein